jgi:hypothetical protein
LHTAFSPIPFPAYSSWDPAHVKSILLGQRRQPFSNLRVSPPYHCKAIPWGLCKSVRPVVLTRVPNAVLGIMNRTIFVILVIEFTKSQRLCVFSVRREILLYKVRRIKNIIIIIKSEEKKLLRDTTTTAGTHHWKKTN